MKEQNEITKNKVIDSLVDDIFGNGLNNVNDETLFKRRNLELNNKVHETF